MLVAWEMLPVLSVYALQDGGTAIVFWALIAGVIGMTLSTHPWPRWRRCELHGPSIPHMYTMLTSCFQGSPQPEVSCRMQPQIELKTDS